MNKEYVQQFYNELCKLQDEYGLYVDAEIWEDTDYDLDDRLYIADYGAYLRIINEDSLEVANIIRGSEELYINEYNCE